MKRTIQFLALVLFLIGFISLSSCNKSKRSAEDVRSNEELFSGLILDYTQGEIVPGDPVRIVFKEAMVAEDAIGKPLDTKILQFDPIYKGMLKWENASVLVFEPETPSYNTRFKASLDVKGLLKDQKDLNIPTESFQFGFHTYPLELTVYMDPMRIKRSDSGSGTEVAIDGRMVFNAKVDSTLVEELLSIDTDNQTGTISWIHEDREHRFILSGIQRTKEIGTLVIQVDEREALGLANRYEKRFIIPAEGTFKVLNAEKKPGSDREIIISFSDLVDEKMDLNGLIGLRDVDQQPVFNLKDNSVHVIFKSALEGKKTLYISKSIKSIGGKKLSDNFESELFFSSPKPEVRLLSQGVISAETKSVILPFEAINLHAVDVEIAKVYENNMLQFLQYGNLSETYLPSEVSEIIWQDKVDLSTLSSDGESSQWNRYGLDLVKLVSLETGALYNVRIGFRKAYAAYPCNEENENAFKEAGFIQPGHLDNGSYQTIWRNWYNYPNRQWSDRNDPCKPMYYTADRFVQQNILASNMGLMAKYNGRDKLLASVVDLRSGAPRSGVNLKVYSYQQQVIGEATTDDQGFAELKVGSKAFFMVAEDGNEHGYLKLNEYQALSMSEFEVSGKKEVTGIDGYIYAERGVWRPGDTLFLQFVLRDAENELPADHPVSLTLTDPSGKMYKTITTARHTGPIYDFTCWTDPNVKTGNWQAKVSVGPRNFYKTLKIETVKPNRLKIEMDLPEKDLVLDQSELDLNVQWLTGLAGSNLEVDVDASLRSVTTRFKKYGSYRFDDVTRKFSPAELTIFRDKLDESGNARIPLKLNHQYHFPGKINALFKIRAYEPSGEFSSNTYSAQISPFTSYVGIQFPTTRWGSASIKTNTKYDIPVITLDSDGNPEPNRKLSVGIYEARWHWWWDDSGNEMAQFNNDQHISAFRKLDLKTDAAGKTSMDLELEDYGAYMIRICDTESGHCTGQLFYTGSYGGGQEGAREFASMLNFSADKESYGIGETAKLSIPAGQNARVLVTVETDGQVLKKEWVQSAEEVLEYSFETTRDMFPNAYAHVVVIQGLEDRKNDLPVRQYGVLNISIEDAAKKLQPEIAMKDVLQPARSYEVTVSEKEGREMYYTLAVVDDGLLDLTRFKTPELFDHFYAKRALLTKNWDNYDEVISARPGLMDRIISIGGDDAVDVQNDADKANRFKPVVEFVGPFHLEKGEKLKHQLAMPNYSGSVRVMVVAASENAYGSAEKTVKVKDDVMALITAPRVLSPAETIELPVTVFVTEPSINSVEVSLGNEKLFELKSDRSQLLRFDQPGEQICYFTLKTKELEGVGKLEVVAKASKAMARQSLEIQIENPNVYQRSSETMAIPAGQTREFNIPVIGMEGTNFAELEMSLLPALGIEERVGYLLRYPYGCIEQTTSAVFPQLFLDNLIDLSQDRQNRIKLHLIEGIHRMRSFQLSNDGMSYWPGSRSPSDWGSTYAAHFLVEAKLQGYNTSSVLPGLLKYLERVTRDYRIAKINSSAYDHQVIQQAYRTMVLARAGKPQFGAMNYLFRAEKLPQLAKWYLSLAYSYTGKKDIAAQLVRNYTLPDEYYYNYYHYGSHLRDYAVLLLALDEAGRTTSSAEVLLQMVKIYKQRNYWNTQSSAWFLHALGKHVGKEKDKQLKFSVMLKEGEEEIDTEKPVYTFNLGEEAFKATRFSVTNNGASDLFVSYTSHGKPVMGDEGAASAKYLDFSVVYLDESGKPMDINTLKMGTEFTAVVTIDRKGLNRSVDEMALSQVFPSGWEILNWRMEGDNRNNDYRLDYQDIRDDRVYSFFDLHSKAITVEIPLHASYAGNFYLPQTFVEAMYEDDIYAKQAGKWVRVVR